MQEITETLVKASLLPIPANANKFTRGRLLLVAGSYGMVGALILSARAALRAGVGYLNAAVPKGIYPLVAGALPEVVFSVYDENDPADLCEKLTQGKLKADAVAIGPGLGHLRERVCPVVFEGEKRPMVIDADALNYLASAANVPAFSPSLTVITPHAGEMARLLGKTSAEVEADREGAALAACRKYGATVLLKGPETLVTDGTTTYFNTHATPALARAGSGDVLTGILGSLLAQGAPALLASASAAFIHGASGLLVERSVGRRSVTMSEVADKVGEVVKELEQASLR